MQAFAQPTAGLVAHYTFDGNVNDVSGNSNNGTVYGATLTTDQYGNPNSAYYFNGINDYINLPFNAFQLNEYSYSICLKVIANPSPLNQVTAFSVGNSTADQHIGIVRGNPYPVGIGVGSYYAPGVAPPDRALVGTLPALNTYYHVIGTRSSTTLKLYMDGVFVDSVVVHNAIPSYGIGTIQALIGCRVGNIQYFQGVIDDLAVYNRTLSDSEIQNYSCSSCSIAINLGNDTTVCAGNSITLNAGNPGASYQWYLGNTLFLNDTLQTYQPVLSGMYHVTASKSACSSSDSITINIHPDYYSLRPQVISCSSYLLPWGVNAVTTNTYTHTYITVDGCDSIISIPVIINPTYNFTTNSATACDRYTLPWGGIVTTSNVYNHTYQTVNGCDSIRNVHVMIHYSPVVTALSNSPICNGDSLLLMSTSNVNVSYTWSGPNGFHSNLPNPVLTNFDLLDTGIYTLHTGISANGCSANPIQIHVISANTQVDVTPSSNAPCIGDTLFLTTDYFSNIIYNWIGPNGFESHLQNPFVLNFSFRDTGIYSLSIQTNGCSSDPSYIYERTLISSIDRIQLPNVFSPNNDSNNDVYSLADLQNFEMKIFNSWGQELTRLSPSNDTWDGTHSNHPVPEGIYFYILRGLNCNGASITRTGNISVFR